MHYVMQLCKCPRCLAVFVDAAPYVELPTRDFVEVAKMPRQECNACVRARSSKEQYVRYLKAQKLMQDRAVSITSLSLSPLEIHTRSVSAAK